MMPDWSRVTLEHVQQACEMYDAGTAVPKRPAQSTFLLLNGKTYPAKFIRGLAYRLATADEPDPNRHYSGGAETARFFQGLGLPTQHDPSSGPAGSARTAAAPTTQAAFRPAVDEIRKLALVSHDYNVPNCGGLYDYSEHFARINKLSDEERCDTILYALYTWDQNSTVARNHDAIFEGMVHVRRVVLEVGQSPENYVEVWLRGQQAPALAHQRFATSSFPGPIQQAFINDLPTRQVADALLVICGETNIASTVRGSEDFYDPYGFAGRLREMNIRLVLNPIHDYMTRHEMRKKRRHYSLGGRTVISVWNKGRGKESDWPWTVFHDGVERTDAVRELPEPFSDRPDIRIGIVDLQSL